MTFFRDWLLGIVAAALAVALAQALTPEGAVKKASRLAGGLVLLLAVVKPLTAFAPEDLPALGRDLAPAAEAAEQAGDETMKILIAQKTGAYIVDKGSALGFPCTAEVTVAEDGSGWAVPWSAQLTGRWTAEGRNALSRMLAEDLGIPAERQTFQEAGP